MKENTTKKYTKDYTEHEEWLQDKAEKHANREFDRKYAAAMALQKLIGVLMLVISLACILWVDEIDCGYVLVLIGFGIYSLVAKDPITYQW